MLLLGEIIKTLGQLLRIIPALPDEELARRAAEKTDFKVVDFNKQELKKMWNYLVFRHKLRQKARQLKRTKYMLPDGETIPSAYYKAVKELEESDI